MGASVGEKLSAKGNAFQASLEKLSQSLTKEQAKNISAKANFLETKLSSQSLKNFNSHFDKNRNDDDFI